MRTAITTITTNTTNTTNSGYEHKREREHEYKHEYEQEYDLELAPVLLPPWKGTFKMDFWHVVDTSRYQTPNLSSMKKTWGIVFCCQNRLILAPKTRIPKKRPKLRTCTAIHCSHGPYWPSGGILKVQGMLSIHLFDMCRVWSTLFQK